MLIIYIPVALIYLCVPIAPAIPLRAVHLQMYLLMYRRIMSIEKKRVRWVGSYTLVRVFIVFPGPPKEMDREIQDGCLSLYCNSVVS